MAERLGREQLAQWAKRIDDAGRTAREALALMDDLGTLDGIVQRLLDGTWTPDVANGVWFKTDEVFTEEPMTPAEVAWFTAHQEVNGG